MITFKQFLMAEAEDDDSHFDKMLSNFPKGAKEGTWHFETAQEGPNQSAHDYLFLETDDHVFSVTFKKEHQGWDTWVCSVWNIEKDEKEKPDEDADGAEGVKEWCAEFDIPFPGNALLKKLFPK